MIKLSEVKKLAALARIKMSDSELKEASKDIDSILSFVSEVETVSTKAKEQLELSSKNVMREDGAPHESDLYSQELLSSAPVREGDYVKVKKIL